MSTMQGFPTQQKTTTARPQYVTANAAGSGKLGLDTIPKSYFRNGAIKTVVSFNKDTKTLNIVAHGAILGDVLRFETGTNAFIEFPITAITDVDNIVVASEVAISAPIGGDTAYIMRASSSRVASDGTPIVTVVPAPIEYVLNAVNTNVSQDTGTPANSRPLPIRILNINGTVLDPLTLATVASQTTGNAFLASIDLKLSALTPSYQEKIGQDAITPTVITAPANAKKLKIMTDINNTTDVRVKVGGAVSSTTSGMQLQPGRSEDFPFAGDVSIIMESGIGNIFFQFGA